MFTYILTRYNSRLCTSFCQNFRLSSGLKWASGLRQMSNKQKILPGTRFTPSLLLWPFFKRLQIFMRVDSSLLSSWPSHEQGTPSEKQEFIPIFPKSPFGVEWSPWFSNIFRTYRPKRAIRPPLRRPKCSASNIYIALNLVIRLYSRSQDPFIFALIGNWKARIRIRTWPGGA